MPAHGSALTHLSPAAQQACTYSILKVPARRCRDRPTDGGLGGVDAVAGNGAGQTHRKVERAKAQQVKYLLPAGSQDPIILKQTGQTTDLMYIGFGSATLEASAITEVERYCVEPGQACSYMVGKLTWLRLRAKARAALGAKFDIRKFHDVALLNGAMPLAVLETVVDAWIATTKAG